MDTAGGRDAAFLVLAGLTVDHEDLVGRAAFVATEDGGEGDKYDRHDDQNQVELHRRQIFK